MAKKFTIDARLILQLGRDSIKSHTTALVELIKNSYDADASKVEVEIFCDKGKKNQIRISDNGFGMTEKEIDNHWLRIGFSEKKESKVSKKGRRKTGEKGIGRIAADRLGSILRMTTKSEDDEAQGVEVDWDEFDVKGKTIDNVEIKAITSPKVNIPQRHDRPISLTGTELIIQNLRQPWTKDNIRDFYVELSMFSPLIGDELEVDFRNDVDPTFSRKIQAAIYDAAEIELKLHFDGKGKLIYEYKNKLLPKRNKSEIFDLSTFLSRQSSLNKNLTQLNCGPVDIDLYFFVRKLELLEGTTFTLTDLKSFLAENAGVRIYRDKIVVKPYGFPHSEFGRDWLGLDLRRSKNPAGVGRSTYTVNANQLVGSVKISRDQNADLKDSAAREGLVENEAFHDLQGLVLGSINLLESYRYELTKELSNDNSKVEKVKSTHSRVDTIMSKLNMVVNEINEIKSYVDKHKDYKGGPIASTITKVTQAIEETEKTFDQLLEEKRVLNALATLGISSAVFGHETESAINTFRDSASNALGYLSKRKPEVVSALDELKEAVVQAKLVAGWGVFALSRIENEKRKRRDRQITAIITKALSQVQPAFDANEIVIKKEMDRVVAKVFTMDIESIVINLLTNSFNAVLSSKKKPTIRIELTHENKDAQKGFRLTIADSGPGIATEYLDKIWLPLWTTKVGQKGRDGTGLGLTIVKSIVDELEGDIVVLKDKQLGGASFSIWLPK